MNVCIKILANVVSYVMYCVYFWIVYNWTVDDVNEWLCNVVHLPQYSVNFRKNRIRGKDMPWYVLYVAVHILDAIAMCPGIVILRRGFFVMLVHFPVGLPSMEKEWFKINLALLIVVTGRSLHCEPWTLFCLVHSKVSIISVILGYLVKYLYIWLFILYLSCCFDNIVYLYHLRVFSVIFLSVFKLLFQ